MHAELGGVRFRSQRKGALTDEQSERQPADPLHARGGLQGSHALRDRAKDIGPGVARISVGTQPEMERLIRKIKRYWKR